MIIIDESGGGEAVFTADASKVPKDLDGCNKGSALRESMVISEGDRAASGDTPCAQVFLVD